MPSDAERYGCSATASGCSARVDSVRERYAGPSAALLPDGRLLWDAEARDALLASRREVTHLDVGSAPAPSPAGSTAGGLLLVHSHRHKVVDFELLARVVDVSSRLPAMASPAHGTFSNLTQGLESGRDASGVLRRLSLLIINNDASHQAADRASTSHPVQWLRLFARRDTNYMPLRMLLLDSLNAGYNCGEMLALSQAADITALFPWGARTHRLGSARGTHTSAQDQAASQQCDVRN